jgi:hypothetical protein
MLEYHCFCSLVYGFHWWRWRLEKSLPSAKERRLRAKWTAMISVRLTLMFASLLLSIVIGFNMSLSYGIKRFLFSHSLLSCVRSLRFIYFRINISVLSLHLKPEIPRLRIIHSLSYMYVGLSSSSAGSFPYITRVGFQEELCSQPQSAPELKSSDTQKG